MKVKEFITDGMVKNYMKQMTVNVSVTVDTVGEIEWTKAADVWLGILNEYKQQCSSASEFMAAIMTELNAIYLFYCNVPEGKAIYVKVLDIVKRMLEDFDVPEGK